ncbi:MAG: hypothetical protein DMF69_17025 [Acidobacteria bacterium]|nr:MAG: hypothetical protein DMF69_17025 [Acidobacteriota bacterium]
MSNTKYALTVVLGLLLTSIAFANFESAVNETKSITILAPDSPGSTSTFFTVRPDFRRCASPMCGGYFVKRVNQTVTNCANGRKMAECYVASLDWANTSGVPIDRALLRGTLLTRGDRKGKYGVLKVEEAWQASSDSRPSGEFYRVRDLGLRCIAAPCLSHNEAKLNTTLSRKIAGVDINSIGALDDLVSQASQAMTGAEGVLVAGTHATVTGPAGRAQMLKATQFYLKASVGTSNLKPCIKTGCSGEICADDTRMSTCIYRSEYECYKKASCERQSNGNCGFTRTPELTSCLARK